MTHRTAAQALVEALLAQDVDHVFCVPGESYLAVLDALADHGDKIRVIACRHESGASNMAEAYGKLTGKPGVCMVTRGPGATNASIGVHTAEQDSTPMVMFVGQIARDQRGRGAFQEVDYVATLGGLAKLAMELDDPERVDEIVERAFSTALRGRKGPVIVALPEDMQEFEVAPSTSAKVEPRPSGLEPAVAREIVDRLAAAQKPLLLLGGSGWDDASLEALKAWAEAAALPVVLSFRRKDLWDNDHPCYAGDLGLGTNPKLLARVKDADVVLAIGARIGENVSQGYTLFTRDEAARKLIHIHAEPSELGRVWPTAIAAVADVVSAAHALAAIPLKADWSAARDAAHAEYQAFSKPVAVTGAVNLSEVFSSLDTALGPDAIVCNGAGNYAAWLHRFHRHHKRGTQLAPTSGAMGYGVPAAVAAKLVHPEREVVAVAGDGCFLMTAQELATAAQYGAGVVFIVVDNGAYGTIRMHQERRYPARISATELVNPDFAAYARAFGGWAEMVDTTAAFAPALEAARAAARETGRPALIHLKTSVEDIAPGRTITDLRALSK